LQRVHDKGSVRQAMPRTVVIFLLSLIAMPVIAQGNYPEQPVRILVGFTAGVAPDVTGRLLAEKLGVAWGRPVVVENITGAGGNIAADRLAKSPPNGYTLGMIGNGSLVFSPSLYQKLSFNPVKDFAPISQIFVGACAAGRAHLRACRRGNLAAPRRGALQVHGRHRYPAGRVPWHDGAPPRS